MASARLLEMSFIKPICSANYTVYCSSLDGGAGQLVAIIRNLSANP